LRYAEVSGFALVEPGRLSLAAQIAAFKNAKEIVGVSGAEMTNIAFAPRGARVMNIAPAGMPDTFFWFIAGLRGHTYAELRCAQTGPCRGVAAGTPISCLNARICTTCSATRHDRYAPMPLLSKPRVIYVLCPPQSETGGPEALHQLASTLFRLGHQVYVVYTHGALPQEVEAAAMPSATWYFRFRRSNPAGLQEVRRTLHQHRFRYARRDPGVPEVWPQFLSLPRQARIYYWWLSLDYGLFALEKSGGLAFLKTTGAVNLCQSSYALTHLEAAGVEDLYMLSDYTYVPASRAYDMRTERRDVVLYNRKGAHFASQVRDAAPHMEFHLLSAMPREEVRSAFRTSKVYMDLAPIRARIGCPVRRLAWLLCDRLS